MHKNGNSGQQKDTGHSDRRSHLKWLYPGMHVKRWLVVLIVGITAISLGLAYLLREFYTVASLPPVFYYLTLQFFPRAVRALLFSIVGIAAVVLAFVQLSRSVLAPFLYPGQQPDLADAVYRHRLRQRGPKIVAIGGGTGLGIVLRGLKEYTSNITAIVTVADDGGSSGVLRRELGMLPPGDFRNCITALSEAEALTTNLFQYRFGEGVGLNGHSFGNLFIAAMAGVTGSFEQGLLESSRVLAVRGRVLPSTLKMVTLVAELQEETVGGTDWKRVAGESNIPGPGRYIERVYLEPNDPPAYPETVRAILEAEFIVAGPGSLFTSVLPNLLVPDIARAISVSDATKVYVCNVATQKGETEGFDVDAHIQALMRHVGPLFRIVLANDCFVGSPDQVGSWVTLPKSLPQDYMLFTADLADRNYPWRHDAKRLASALYDLYETQQD